ncbi:MAG TPA: ABC transporter ATP-binding protein [Candidatus Fimihabitans intestinipullorum]|uniref:ABC transporter ATP-binding protein n=1 Tax=Candidatus Fimihabitans intestinipullorum TaxID=2840820 RepID=A0A9D1L3W3_9BACT|nr:ABC transporter ATP-binding protein [Candidatus Fimihabitans intestinipullorum]
MKSAVKIHNLTKQYDSKFQLNVDLEIPKGMIIGLIGENGAGKTTLMKSMLDIIHPEQGTISFEKGSEHVGVVLDQSFFPEILTPMDIHYIMKDIYSTWDADMYFRYMKDFDLPLHKAIKTMSKGMRKKLEIATAFSHHPSLLILDEPTSGLDPVVRSEVLDLFLEFIQDENHTILFSTHITSDLEHIADYIIFLDDGKIILKENRDTLLEEYGVLKCSEKEWKTIDPKDYVTYKKGKYQYELLVTDQKRMKKKYPNMVVDRISLEELMVLTIKGVKVC